MTSPYTARALILARADLRTEPALEPAEPPIAAVFREVASEVGADDCTPFAAGLRRYQLEAKSIFPEFAAPKQPALRSAVRASAQLRTPPIRASVVTRSTAVLLDRRALEVPDVPRLAPRHDDADARPGERAHRHASLARYRLGSGC